jgi:hypothetical protein
MDGALGYTNIIQPLGDNTFINSSTGIGLEVSNQFLNISNDVFFENHGPGFSSLHIVNATVSVSPAQFIDQDVAGNAIFIEGEGSNDTVVDLCSFNQGQPGEHFIRVDGASPLIRNSTFIGISPSGPLTVIANDLTYPGQPILRNPNPPGTFFDNATINATGSSSVILQWYKDVYVEDPDGNPIPNAPVWIVDSLGNPAQPPSKIANAMGWAIGFIVTELIQYFNTRDIFNPFNISAENASMFGYITPEETISQSIEFPILNTVIVPFNPIANIPPLVSFIDLVPPGVQSGQVTVQFRLSDPNPGDDGNMSITVEYWDPTDSNWVPALLDPSSDTDNLNNDTLYTIIWISNDATQLPDFYDTGVDIRITAYDKAGIGGNLTTGPFTLDNKAPTFLTGPVVTVTNTTALIEWTVDETAEARVWYGLTLTPPVFTFTTEVIGNTGMSQSVQLTSLQPGRNYTYAINSTDPEGNKRSSYGVIDLSFETEIHIQLYKGWNMISIPPFLQGVSISDTLANIAGQYDALQMYDVLDPSGDPWKHYLLGKPFGNDLLFLDDIHGFWIHMKSDAVLIPKHTDPTTGPIFPGYTSVPLWAGWNFVGYPSVVDLTTNTVLSGVPYDKILTYDEGSGNWLTYDGSSGSLTTMKMGKGYWIYVNMDYSWDVDYAP